MKDICKPIDGKIPGDWPTTLAELADRHEWARSKRSWTGGILMEETRYALALRQKLSNPMARVCTNADTGPLNDKMFLTINGKPTWRGNTIVNGPEMPPICWVTVAADAHPRKIARALLLLAERFHAEWHKKKGRLA